MPSKTKICKPQLNECFIRLNSDSWPFKKGTEFISTSSDDGMFSLNPTYSGTLELNGLKIYHCFDAEKCDIITANEYTGKVLAYKEKSRPMTMEEFWEEYYNSPG